VKAELADRFPSYAVAKRPLFDCIEAVSGDGT
jgi:hypothetical protein